MNWVEGAYIEVYGKTRLIKNRAQPPLRTYVQSTCTSIGVLHVELYVGNLCTELDSRRQETVTMSLYRITAARKIIASTKMVTTVHCGIIF